MNSGDNIVGVIIGATIFMFLLSSFLIYFFVQYRHRQILHKKEKHQLQLKYNQALLESQLEIQEQLLQQISGEIHDNLGQVAALIKINLATFPKDLSPEALEKLEQTRELMRKLSADLKSLSVNLNTDYLQDEGLMKVLEREAEKLNKSGILKVHFSAVGYLPSLEVGKEVFLYRMVQELISNVLKHAEAKELILSMDANEKELTILIRDNGKGFDPDLIETNGNKTSTGLKSLKKRSLLIGAGLEIQSNNDNGTSVKIYLPLNHS